MLAALLVNLADYQQPARDADGGAAVRERPRRVLPDRPVTRDDVIQAANELEVLAEQEKSLRAVPKKVRDYVAAEVVQVDEVSNLQAELSVLEFEYRQSMLREQQEDRLQTILILEQISVILRYVQDEEEAIIALLLA